jgi:cytidyltransferase-like protein
MSQRSVIGRRRIGILGGTLDPIHCGHLAAATAARDAFDLSEVLVLPSRIPPHRAVQPLASPYHRFAMASLAVSGGPKLFASDDELRLDGPSYTAETLDRQLAGGLTRSQIFSLPAPTPSQILPRGSAIPRSSSSRTSSSSRGRGTASTRFRRGFRGSRTACDLDQDRRPLTAATR